MSVPVHAVAVEYTLPPCGPPPQQTGSGLRSGPAVQRTLVANEPTREPVPALGKHVRYIDFTRAYALWVNIDMPCR